MSYIATAALVVYAAGVVWGLLVSDGRPLERAILAVLWPLGPLAFVVTISILFAASVIAYPTVMVPALMAVAALIWWAFF